MSEAVSYPWEGFCLSRMTQMWSAELPASRCSALRPVIHASLVGGPYGGFLTGCTAVRSESPRAELSFSARARSGRGVDENTQPTGL